MTYNDSSSFAPRHARPNKFESSSERRGWSSFTSRSKRVVGGAALVLASGTGLAVGAFSGLEMGGDSRATTQASAEAFEPTTDQSVEVLGDGAYKVDVSIETAARMRSDALNAMAERLYGSDAKIAPVYGKDQEGNSVVTFSDTKETPSQDGGVDISTYRVTIDGRALQGIDALNDPNEVVGAGLQAAAEADTRLNSFSTTVSFSESNNGKNGSSKRVVIGRDDKRGDGGSGDRRFTEVTVRNDTEAAPEKPNKNDIVGWAKAAVRGMASPKS
jgi:hypothetical protein